MSVTATIYVVTGAVVGLIVVVVTVAVVTVFIVNDVLWINSQYDIYTA